MDDAAIKPSMPTDPFSLTTDDEARDSTEADEQVAELERAVGDLQHHIGFQHIRQLLEETIQEYRTGKQMSVSAKDDYETIGRKYLVSSLVASELESILGVIDAAATSK